MKHLMNILCRGAWVWALTLAAMAAPPSQDPTSDPSLTAGGPSPAALRWLSITNAPIEVNGLPWFRENSNQLSRLPLRLKSTFRKEVWSLAQSPSGGRLRFRTDASILSVRLEYPSPPNMANMHAFGQTGVDLYADGVYMVSATAETNSKPGKVCERVLFDFSKQPRVEREITLYLPLYKPVKVLGIGVDAKASLSPPKAFSTSRPVVFYGTSITQGGCASRSGMSYEAILGRKLNLDFVNLGFSGNGLGEPEVARAVAEIEASCYVLDFGANHKTFEAMREVYAPFLDYIRAQHPTTPIVVMTILHTSRENRIPTLGKEWPERRQFIEKVVRERMKAGDKNLYLVDGATLLGPEPDDCFVDGGHPNDLGFYRMAEGLAPMMRSVLPKPDLTVAPADKLVELIQTSVHATKPDFIAYMPKVTDGEAVDTGNEHFMVFDGPDGSLMALWSQSSFEGQNDQHIVLARSEDKGKTWSAPRIIAGPAKPGEGFSANWGLPLVSKSGRIYVLYFQSGPKWDGGRNVSTLLTGIYSDDHGKTWFKPQTLDMPRTSRDNPDASYPPNCIIWQKPLRLTRDGRYLVGMTHTTSPAVKKNPGKHWSSMDSAVEFLRFENLDENPEPAQLKISWLAYDKDALTMPHRDFPQVSVCQEPSIVKLPDGRLFCVMRTMSGSPCWTQSKDDGDTWTPPRILLRKDGGEPLKHPLSPCPIFDLGGGGAGSGRYVLFIHNHDGNYQQFGVTDSHYHRRPIYQVLGKFQPKAEQPVWFEEPAFFMDHDGIPLGPPGKRGRLDLAMYATLHLIGGQPVLWYPDRKFFLLGKKLEVP